MKGLLPVFVFGGFVALGLLAALYGRLAGGALRPRALNAFLLYTLAVSFGAGLLQRDLWPFSNWPLVAGIQGPVARHDRLVGVDRLGREQGVDARAWQPFVYEELLAWARRRMMELPPADRDRAADFLVRLLEDRRQAALGGRVGYFDRVWGPFTAPYFLLHPRSWSPPSRVPVEPLVGIRLYLESWDLEARRLDPSAVQRSLVYEYVRP